MTLKVGVANPPRNLDPRYSSDLISQQITPLIYRSLIYIDRDLGPLCDLCESFSEYENQIKLTLKRNQYFHDGSKIDAKVISDTILLYQQESLFSSAFKKIKQVEHLNNTITLTYHEYSEDNLTDLYLLKIFKIVNSQLIGSGEYRLHDKNNQKAHLVSLNSNLPHITFFFIKDETTLILKLKKGELHLIGSSLSARKVKYAKKNFQLFEVKSNSLVYVGVNFAKSELQKFEIRNLLYQSIPFEPLITYRMHYLVDRAQSFFTPENFQFDNKEFSPRETPLYLKILVGPSKESLDVAKILKYYYSSKNIQLEVKQMEWSLFNLQLERGHFDLFISSWVGYLSPKIVDLALSSEHFPPLGRNRGRYHNPQMDELLKNKKYQEANNLVYRDLAYLPLWHPKIRWIGINCLPNINMYQNGSFRALTEVNFPANDTCLL